MKERTKLNLLKTISYVGVTVSTFGASYAASLFIQTGDFVHLFIAVINLAAVGLNANNIIHINSLLSQVKVPVRSEVVRRD